MFFPIEQQLRVNKVLHEECVELFQSIVSVSYSSKILHRKNRVHQLDLSIKMENFAGKEEANEESDNYICITDIAKAKTGESRSADVVKNWLRNRNTLEFLGTWEMIYNPDFKVVEFDHFKSHAGLHTFVLSVAEWINKTNAIGLYVKRGEKLIQS